MVRKGLNEGETRAKLIDPRLYACGWTDDLIKNEESAGTLNLLTGKRSKGRVDYTLRVKLHPDNRSVAVALIEAKAEHLPPARGLEQAKLYADGKRLHVPFVFASNGHRFVEFDTFTGMTSKPRPMAAFPSPDVLRGRYEERMGFRLSDPAARPLLTRYAGARRRGATTRTRRSGRCWSRSPGRRRGGKRGGRCSRWPRVPGRRSSR